MNVCLHVLVRCHGRYGLESSKQEQSVGQGSVLQREDAISGVAFVCTQQGEGAGARWVCLYNCAMCISCLIKTHCFKHPRILADTRQQYLPADRQPSC